MRSIVLCLALAACGCQSYTQVQMSLVDEARKGVKLCAQSAENRAELIRQLQALRRQRLDEAFDADVRSATTLTPQWVIEARKAYAVGLDALAKQQSAAMQAEQTEQQNLQAIDEAMQKLYWLQSIQLRWSLPDKEIKP